MRESLALDYVMSVRKEDSGIGGEKIWYMYRDDFDGNDPIGRDWFLSLIDRYNLKVRHKIRRPRTTDSRHGLPTYPNIIKDLIPTRPNQLWVSDITYITMWKSADHYKFCYLSLIMDAFTKEIVGWDVGPTLGLKHPLNALKMALSRLNGEKATDLIHHSDRGCQYVSSEYVKLLKDNNIRISMTETGEPTENPQAERINNTIKNEFLRGVRFTSVNQVRDAVAKAVDFYNNKRPHMSINMMTPAQAALCEGEIKKWWISYRERAIKRNLCLENSENPLPLQPTLVAYESNQPPVNL